MSPLDWGIVACYFAVLLAIGLWPRRRAANTDEYFVSGRALPWWMAGTSLIAASFASDTPLMVSGLARSQGLWGNWSWLALGVSTVLAAFLFAPLWRRAAVVTDAELTELRYSGRSAAVLRGGKAIYWGLLFNAYAAGALAVTGLGKVMSVTTGLGQTEAILICGALGGVYAIVSGLWGLVMTDLFQFGVAIVGGVVLAVASVNAAGGLDKLSMGPMIPTEGEGLEYCLPFLCISWWAWKNTDGSGVMVQRWSACRSEGHALGATLWYAVVHYGVRLWPWALVGAASVVVIPEATDAEGAYPLMILKVLGPGMRGFILAWFLAEFMSAVAQSMNWGGSLLVNDFYRRFVVRDGSPAHYVAAARVAGALIMAGAMATAFFSGNIGKAFTYILSATAAIGVVSMLRWLWWRVNAWSEITAMVVSPVLTVVLADVKPPMVRTLWIVLGGTVPAILAGLITAPASRERLKAFYERVRPPGMWGPVAAICPGVRTPTSLRKILVLWILGLALVYGILWGGWALVSGRVPYGFAVAAAGAAGLLYARRSREGGEDLLGAGGEAGIR